MMQVNWKIQTSFVYSQTISAVFIDHTRGPISPKIFCSPSMGCFTYYRAGST